MSLLGMLPGGEQERAVCSRKGCRAAAAWELLWNNPRIHTPERRKVWLACDEHREWLEDYLKTRSLWVETVPHREPASVPSTDTDGGR